MEARAFTGSRTQHNPLRLGKQDLQIAGVLLVSLILSIYLKLEGTLDYWPYQSLAVPTPDLAAFAAILFLVAPLFTDHDRVH